MNSASLAGGEGEVQALQLFENQIIDEVAALRLGEHLGRHLVLVRHAATVAIAILLKCPGRDRAPRHYRAL